MRLLHLIRGAVVPHAPVLLPQIAGPETDAAGARIRAALSDIDPGSFDVVVVLSPHGRATGVHRHPTGGLDGFGYPNIGVEIQGDETIASALADAWRVPLVNDPIDHGIVVPFALWEPKTAPARIPSLVTATLAETAVDDDPSSFADALVASTKGKSVLFVASVNGAAALSPRAPLTEIDGARDLEDGFLAALRSDAAEVESAARRLAVEAGSCGLGPLIAFSRLFAGRSCRVLAHEEPVGVGYTVALTDD